jgi:hypothetical protein
MRYFVTPEGWLDEAGQLKAVHTSPVGAADSNVEAIALPSIETDIGLSESAMMWISPLQLKPYVFKRRPSRETPKIPTDWPKAALGKPEEDYESARQGIYSPKGFNGEYYLQLAELNRGRTPA